MSEIEIPIKLYIYSKISQYLQYGGCVDVLHITVQLDEYSEAISTRITSGYTM